MDDIELEEKYISQLVFWEINYGYAENVQPSLGRHRCEIESRLRRTVIS